MYLRSLVVEVESRMANLDRDPTRRPDTRRDQWDFYADAMQQLLSSKTVHLSPSGVGIHTY